MSLKLMSAVWESNIESGRRLLALAIADSCNDKGIGWPSVGELARKCDIDPRSVQRQLLDLEPFVTREFRRGRSTIYHMNIEAIRSYEPPTPASPHTPDSGVTPTPDASVTPDSNVTPDASVTKPPTPASPTPDASVTQNHLEPFKNRNKESVRAKDSEPKPDPPNSRRVRKLEDLILDEQDRAWCAEKYPGVDPDAMVEELRDWKAKKRKNRYDDWRAGWRTFCRTEYEKIQSRPKVKTDKHRLTATDIHQSMRDADAILRKSPREPYA